MLQIDDTVISLDLFDECFACDIAACRGACCIEGDAGAPLEWEEIPIIENLLPAIWNDLSEKSREIIDRQGVFYIDEADSEPVTSIVGGRECVFTCIDKDDCCRCAIEKAFCDRKTDFYKPISCHLYPVRLQKYESFTAVNYHRWNVCKCAVNLGKQTKTPVYQFLREPLTRRFGADWFAQMEIAAKEMKKTKN